MKGTTSIASLLAPKATINQILNVFLVLAAAKDA